MVIGEEGKKVGAFEHFSVASLGSFPEKNDNRSPTSAGLRRRLLVTDVVCEAGDPSERDGGRHRRHWIRESQQRVHATTAALFFAADGSAKPFS